MTDARDSARTELPPAAKMDRPDGTALLSTVRAASAITGNLEAVLRDSGSGLHANDFDALFFLVAEGPMRPSELIRFTVLTRSPATLHKILTRLEAEGRVARSPHPKHARGVIYTATDEGRVTISHLWPTVERQVIHRFGGHFSPEELAQLTDLTARI